MNLLVAAIFLSIVYGIGIPSFVENGQETNYRNVQIQIVEVASNSPAEAAGIKIGDAIIELKVKSQELKVNEIEDVQNFIASHIGEEITITIKRGKEILQETLVPRTSPPEGQGATGIAMSKTGLISYPWYKAIINGFAAAGKLLVTMVSLFYLLIKNLILKGTLLGEIAGPIGIYSLTSQFVKLGAVYVLQFAAIFSINLVIINALPFPALDGGRLLFLLIEKVRSKPINFKTERIANTIGFAILILLLIAVTFRDIVKLF